MRKVTHIKLQMKRGDLHITGFCTPKGGTRFRATSVQVVSIQGLDRTTRREQVAMAMQNLFSETRSRS